MRSDTYTHHSNMSFLLFTLLLCVPCVFTKVPDCCSYIEDDRCRRSCQQVHSQASPIPQMQMLLTAAEGCPPHMIGFWQCIKDNLPAVQLMSVWPGKTCCDMAIGKDCRRSCNSAQTKQDIFPVCRESHESSLFSCIQSQEDSNHCCNKATAPSCNIVCRGIYLTGQSNTRATRNVLSQHCNQVDKKVEQCVHRQWQPKNNNAHIDLPCCDRAQTAHCRSTCRNVLRTVMSENDRVDELIQACSQPSPTDPLWQCFLNNPSAKKNETTPMARIDNAKLLCCGKASSSRCRKLCTQTYKKGWSYLSEFETSCSYIQPVATLEANMHNCLTDVDQPCKLGCSGMSFCSNFNNRPTELFRSCTPQADDAARRVYNLWMNGVIHLPQMIIPVKDIRQCKPAMWKAIACALELKPCSAQQSMITLCKEDCLYILTKCVDATKLSGDKTVPALCNALPSKTEKGACVSMDPYLYGSPFANRDQEVLHPCNPNPCEPDEVCEVRRRKCRHLENCMPYICHKACPLGQASQVLVPKGTRVRLANVDSDVSSMDECHVACHCTGRGNIEHCKPLDCLRREVCVLGHENIREHGDHFLVDGSHCVCHAGELICSRRTCQPDNHSPLYTGMPGNCPSEYSPVCGANGKTYPNSCLAKCAGVTRLVGSRACSDEDVCTHKPCPGGFRCVPRPQICLNHMTGDSCPQFECVNENDDCFSHNHSPACSDKGEEFTNMCTLFAHRRTLGYRGHCQSHCSNTGVVCGHDGETYGSECAAKAARVTVDYPGKCKAFGNVTGSGNGGSVTCMRVTCPPLQPPDCRGIVPPGGCCPVCGAQLNLLWDPRLMSQAAVHIKSKIISAMDVLTSLSQHISIIQCDIFGYVSVNEELIVIVAPVVSQATSLQVEACQSEAERIYSLIRMGSPNIASYLILSPLLLASLEKSTLNLSTSIDPRYISDTLIDAGASKLGGNNASPSRHQLHWGFLLAVLLLVCLTAVRPRLKRLL